MVGNENKSRTTLEKILIAVIGVAGLGGGGFGVTQLIPNLIPPTPVVQETVNVTEVTEQEQTDSLSPMLLSAGGSHTLVVRWKSGSDDLDRVTVVAENADIVVYNEGKPVLRVSVAGTDEISVQKANIDVLRDGVFLLYVECIEVADILQETQ